MIVLHVLEALEGGTSRHLVDVVRHTGGCEHHVALPSRRVGGVTDIGAVEALSDAGASIHRIEMRRLPPHPRNAVALVALRRLLSRVRPAIVHGHSSIGGAIARVATIGTGVPTVYTPNGLATARPALAVERALGRRTTRLVAVSESEAALAARAHLVPLERLVVIPNGIDLDPRGECPDLRAAAGVGPGTPLVGTVARLVAQKAPERFVATAVELARRRPDIHFVFVGDGPGAAAFARAVEGAALEGRFHHVPELPGVGRALGQLDVFVLASRFEGGPYTPLEAMREGTAVVLTDVTGSRDAIEDGRSGLLVPEGDANALADAVSRLLSDGRLRGELVAGGRRRVRECFDVRAMGAALAALYAEVAA